VVKRQIQPSGDAQVLKELQTRFGGNKKPTNKPQSNQIADGELERMMIDLKETGFVAPVNRGLVRKPRSQVGDLQELAAGHREVCRERQA
jgi:ribosomal protein S19E (S16A)